MRLKINLYHLFNLFILLTAVIVLTSCYKFEGAQTVPSYIQVDNILLETYYPEQGSNSHAIKDVWIYENDELIGAFELPALLPVLASGNQKLEIRPGIKVNGISSTRAPYPFYAPVAFENYELYEDSVQVLGEFNAEYSSPLEFGWMEDFEESGLTIEEISTSDTAIKRTEPNDPEAYLSEYSSHSGIVNLTEEKPVWSSISLSSFP